jgi:hypothetical protein
MKTADVRLRTEPESGHVGKVGLEQVFSEYFGFSCCDTFQRLLHIHHHPLSGAGTVGKILSDVRSGLSLIPTQQSEQKTETTLSSVGWVSQSNLRECCHNRYSCVNVC